MNKINLVSNENQAFDLLLRTNQTLQLLATGNPLSVILDDVIDAIESQVAGSRGSILILDRTGRNLCSEAGPSLSAEFHDAVRKFPIGLNTGACGKAAYLNQPVIIENIQTDPACKPFCELAARNQLKAAWSIPIRSISGKVLGTFCVYSDENRSPTDVEMNVMQSFANIAGIAIQNRKNEETLRTNEHRFKKLFKQIYSILGKVSSATGNEFFRELVKSLATTLDIEYCFVGKFIDGEEPQINTLAFWGNGKNGKNFQYKIANTPCERVMNGHNILIFKKDVQKLFPKDPDLETLCVESYSGICLEDENKNNLGILVLMDSKPFTEPEYIHILLSVFAGRVKGELIRMQIEEEMMRAKLESEKSNQAKSEFLARMSHELRTPLNAILGFSQLIPMQIALPEEQAQNVSQITRAGEHLLDLINEILDLTKIDSGQIGLSLEAISLSEFLKEMISLFAPMAREKSVNLELEADLFSSVKVFADRLRLKQVFMNLLSNAIKYNRENGRVSLSYKLVDDSLTRIFVQDTGPGIDPEKLKLVFQPFERLGQDKSHIEGTGIGLTIAKGLMEKMNGNLSATSVPGEGSCFYLDIPKSSTSG